jgi:hypothetical protein
LLARWLKKVITLKSDLHLDPLRLYRRILEGMMEADSPNRSPNSYSRLRDPVRLEELRKGSRALIVNFYSAYTECQSPQPSN